jgi:arginase
VAVCAGLALPVWRELAGVAAPLPTDRIVLVDVRNLDAPEARLIAATDAVVAAVEPGRPGADLGAAVGALAERCDLLYLHIDADILDLSLVPNHGTGEPDGADLPAVARAIDLVMATGKVAACAVVSVYGAGEGSATSVASGIGLIRAALASWKRHGMPGG